MPLKKSGKLPKSQSIFMSDSKAGYSNGCDGYFEKCTLRLIARPCYMTMGDYFHDKPIANVRLLCIETDNATKKKPAIFDANGNPNKLDISRTVYLPDDSIKLGCVYEEKSGTKYLCLTGLVLDELWHDHRNATPYPFHPQLDTRFHWYVRWTAALEKALAAEPTANGLVRHLASKTKDESWTSKLSRRESPRKFVREVCQAFDPALTTSEMFSTEPAKSPYYHNEVVMFSYGYKLYDRNER